MNELVFEVTQDSDGGFVAECLTEAIFTQADTREELAPTREKRLRLSSLARRSPPRSASISYAVKS